jgi:hypothetical protein
MTTRHYQTTLAVAFEGVGSSTSSADGLAFCFGSTPTHSSDYEFARAMIDAPESVETSVNPYTGELSTSSFAFQFPASDAIATKLLHVQVRTPLSVALSFGDSTTVLRVSGTGNTALAGTVVYIDDEAVLVGTHTGSGIYTGCTRGFWSTVATGHGLGVQVYTKNPYINYRRVVLLEVDRTAGTETVRWRGFVDSVSTDNTGKTITVNCMELWATVAGATVNKGAPRLRPSGSVISGSAFGRPIYIGYASTDGRRVRPTSSSAWAQIGDTLTACTSANSKLLFDGPSTYWFGAPQFDAEEKYDEAFEVFVAGDQVSGIGSTDDLTYPSHPVAIAVAMLISSGGGSSSLYDVLGAEWGLAIPEALFDVAAIDALIEETQNVKIDRLLLGWDGEPVQVVSTIREALLRPYGFFLAVTDTGLLSVARLQPTAIDVGTLAQSTPTAPIPDRLSFELASDGQFWQAEAEIGAMPWRDPDKIVVQRDGSFRDNSRRSLFTRSLRLTYNFETIAPSSDTTLILSELLNRIVIGKTAAPIIGITTTRGGTFDIGQTVSLSAPDIQQAWFIDRDGVRVALTADDPSYAGIVIGRRYDLARGIYDLSLLLLNYAGGAFVKWRAHALMIESHDGAGTLTVTANAFHASATDMSYFDDGDDVVLCDKSGVAYAGPYSILINSSTSMSLSGTPAGVVAGDVVRLTYYSDYSNTAHVTGVANPFAYFAKNGALDSDEPDIYG